MAISFLLIVMGFQSAEILAMSATAKIHQLTVVTIAIHSIHLEIDTVMEWLIKLGNSSTIHLALKDSTRKLVRTDSTAKPETTSALINHKFVTMKKIVTTVLTKKVAHLGCFHRTLK